MESFEKEVQVAVEAAREASTVILSVYSRDFDVDYKPGNEPVTEADKKANSILVRRLSEAFPDDAIIAEETVPRDPDELHRRMTNRRVWFVDPIDGTWEFVAKNGEFAVMIGLAIDGRAHLGVVLRPTTGDVAVGVIDQGTWVVDSSGARTTLRVSDVAEPSAGSLLMSRSHHSKRLQRVARKTGAGKLVQCGSVGVKCERIARGINDMYILLPTRGGAKLWDTCAPEVLVRAAGGTATDVRGAPISYRAKTVALTGGLVASNGTLHEVLLGAVEDIPTLT